MLTLLTRLLLLLVLVLSSTITSGQYLSTLNDGQTWAVSGYDIVYFEWRYMAEIYIDGEEVYEGQEYKVLRLNSELASAHPFGLIREDTVAGRVWFRAYYHGDFYVYIDTSEEVLLADYSLETGDQFYYTYLRGYWDDEFFIDSLLYEVEEVGIVDGRKYIQTNSLTVLDDNQNWLWGHAFYHPSFEYPAANQVPLRFIEGIGTSFSLISQNLFTLNSFSVFDAAYPFDPYVLCAHIDDEEIWNDPFVEECFYEGELPLITSVDENEDENKFIVFPNPATSHIRLQLPPEFASQSQITVYNLAGQVVAQRENYNSSDLFPMNHPHGMYIIEARNGNRVARGKVVVE